ncbi:MAG: hypothetical protein A3C11_00080 [Candidatus Sungbacteria bacterium RIFCSPHIGHO2_02_FULL_49_12]|uniref:Prepilin-type N-terminal cleavage/methylation domain-containing protein n=1 Tax=Candidatus Sungbacteria bacterium RIFCSPHIGHO2_02_FULL_49_12 TaxID=1802271 RepID=A0A1G2KT08_9BACT|nr:MAG: hypothetical protein A3C11_00080 [Candidatus Sungbacteria bacterium RIFCSPHIGHO2_02_FULL_49_12]
MMQNLSIANSESDENASVRKVCHIHAHGFTLIEILTTLAALAIIVSIVYGAFSSFRTFTAVDEAASEILSTLRLAQSKTLASVSNAQYGVRILSDRLTVFRGATYSDVSAIETVFLRPIITVADVTLAGGGTDIVFDRLTGRTSMTGTIRVEAKSDSGKFRVITVDAAVQASLGAGALPPGNNRIVDTRHVNFQLGWSIQGATTLTLQFSDPPSADTVENIAMLTYFTSGQTAFDWEGTVTVNGTGQTIRVHTTALSASDTTLSIHRDRRMNDKAVIILIDGKEIARYASDGVITIGPFGGTLTVQ